MASFWSFEKFGAFNLGKNRKWTSAGMGPFRHFLIRSWVPRSVLSHSKNKTGALVVGRPKKVLPVAICAAKVQQYGDLPTELRPHRRTFPVRGMYGSRRKGLWGNSFSASFGQEISLEGNSVGTPRCRGGGFVWVCGPQENSLARKDCS